MKNIETWNREAILEEVDRLERLGADFSCAEGLSTWSGPNHPPEIVDAAMVRRLVAILFSTWPSRNHCARTPTGVRRLAALPALPPLPACKRWGRLGSSMESRAAGERAR